VSELLLTVRVGEETSATVLISFVGLHFVGSLSCHLFASFSKVGGVFLLAKTSYFLSVKA
jgi:hypothetical protein